MLSFMIFCRYSLLRLHGNARGVLHKRHQHPSGHQRHRVRSSPVYLRLHHRLQPAGAQRCVLCFPPSPSTLQFTLSAPPVLNVVDMGFGVIVSHWQFHLTCVFFVFSNLLGDYRDDHVFSLYFMIPFFFTTLALFYHNW